MKLAGVLLIICSAASVGFRIAASLKKRCRLIRKLQTALQIMENEIGFCGTPLPQVFALMAVSVDGALSRVFSLAAREMDKRRWLSPVCALEEAVQTEPEIYEDRDISEILKDLAESLGKYDRESQLQTIQRGKTQLETLMLSAEQECSVRSKTYEVLGICAGVSVAILLL